jgi:hypothetical protein
MALHEWMSSISLCMQMTVSPQTGLATGALVQITTLLEEEEGLQGVFKRLRRNRHQLEKGLQMAQRGRHSSETQPRKNTSSTVRG